jgi:ComF family protein
MSSAWSLTLKNLLLPIFCRQCSDRLLTEENGFFCPTCWELSPRIGRPFCTHCGRPLPQTVGFGEPRNYLCAWCRELKLPEAYRRLYGAARYDQAVAEAVKLFKFQGKTRLVRPLAELMVDFATRELECSAYDLIVPVPLHTVRERARGFNQARLLAEGVMAQFPRARLATALQRVRPTRVQSRLLDESERRANVAGAFVLAKGEDVQGATVLLIDDVVTTAGTVSECAKALMGAGAQAVDVLVAALATPEMN